MTKAVQKTNSKPPVKLVESAGNFQELLMKYQTSIDSLVSKKYMTTDRIIKIAVMAVTKSPLLLKCDRVSLLKAILDSVEVGLEPNTTRQHAAIVPYKNNKRGCYEALFQPMYQGLAELLHRSGKVDRIIMDAVYEGDEFVYDAASGDIDKHTYGKEHGLDPVKNVTHAYARIWIKGAAYPLQVVMNRVQINMIKGRSAAVRSGRSTPWDTDFDKMAMKSAFNRCTKLAPTTESLDNAIAVDQAIEVGEPIHIAQIGQDLEKMLTEADTGESAQEPDQGKTEALTDKIKNETNEKEKPDLRKLFCVKCEKEFPNTLDPVSYNFIQETEELIKITCAPDCESNNQTAAEPPEKEQPKQNVGSLMRYTIAELNVMIKEKIDLVFQGKSKLREVWLSDLVDGSVLADIDLEKNNKGQLANAYLDICKRENKE